MPKVLYVEPDDEITDLVERVRRSADDPELVFVLPNRARVLQSSLNLRLLQQYSRSFIKTTSIVSGDPRVQGLARDAGFPTYASVQAFERGVQVVRPHSPFEGRDGDGGAPAVSGAVAERRPARPVDARAAAAAGASLTNRMRARSWTYIAAVLLAAGLLLLFLVAPTAHVTITVAAAPVSVNATIQGTTDPTAAQGADRVLTTVQTSDATSQIQVKPTEVKDVPAAAATGQVVFTSDLPSGAKFTIHKGEEFDTSDNPPVRFAATADTDVFIPAPQGGSPATSNPVPVADLTPEGRGNVAAGAINQWQNNPCRANGPYSQVCTPKDLTVGNPQPTTGGSDDRKITVVSDQDFQGFNAARDNAVRQLTARVRADMQRKAGGQQFAVDPGGSGTTIDVDPVPLPGVGNEVSPDHQTLTVHVSGKATFYDPAKVRDVVRRDLLDKVPQGDMLAPNESISDPKVVVAADDGTATFSSSGSGYSEPTIDVSGLKDQFAGKSQSSVRDLVQRRLGAAYRDISVDQRIPFFVLPFFSSRIDVEQHIVEEPRSAAPTP